MGRRGPNEWFGIGIGIGDEAVDGELQVNDRLEDAALNKALARELGEEAFDGVKTGRGGRGKVERPTRMTRQPSAYLWVLVGGIVVDDGMDHLSHRALRFAKSRSVDSLNVRMRCGAS